MAFPNILIAPTPHNPTGNMPSIMPGHQMFDQDQKMHMENIREDMDMDGGEEKINKEKRRKN